MSPRNFIRVILTIIAGTIAMRDQDGWGWFLFAVVML